MRFKVVVRVVLRLWHSGILHLLAWYIGTDVTNSLPPSSGWEKEDGGSKCFQNVGICLPNYTGSHVRRP